MLGRVLRYSLGLVRKGTDFLANVLRYTLLGLILLLVYVSSALLAMRFAIHGREVRVPKFAGLTPAEAEKMANANGLVLSVESHFYAPGVPEGRIVSQSPAPDTRVRSGWKVMVAQSLGPQRAAIPNLVGQSEHAVHVNVSHRGLVIGSVATVHLPGAQGGTVLAQTPLPDAKDVTSPKIDLLIVAADNAPLYVMPSFLGIPLTDVKDLLKTAGFVVQVNGMPISVSKNSSATGIIVRQYPVAGQKVMAGATVSFEVRKPRSIETSGDRTVGSSD